MNRRTIALLAGAVGAFLGWGVGLTVGLNKSEAVIEGLPEYRRVLAAAAADLEQIELAEPSMCEPPLDAYFHEGGSAWNGRD